MSDVRNAGPVVFMMGEQIYLRPVEQSDLPRVQRWINDPDTRRFLLNVRPLNEADERKWLDAISSPNEIRLAIVARAGDQHIGGMSLLGIDWVHRHARFGIMIGDPEARGKGYGTQATRMMVKYAFETLNLNRIELDVYEFNTAAIRSYEKAGFAREGVLREMHFSGGRYYDVIRFSILAREYFRDQPPNP